MNYSSSRKLLGTVLSLLLSFSSFAALTGYIGSQSFDLKDDPQLRQHEASVNQAKNELESLVNEAKGQEQIANRSQQLVQKTNQELKQKVDQANTLQAQISSLQQQAKTLKDALASAESDEQKQKIKEQIAANKLEIESKKSSLQIIKQQEESLKTQLIGQQSSLAKEKDLLASKNLAAEQARSKKQQVVAERNSYEEKLIAKILEVNQMGAQEGKEDGQTDGLRLAKDLGIEEGYSDGKRDGRSDGIRAGERRDYSLGHDEGKRIGIAKAQEQGEIDGTKLGTISGNTLAARREGNEAGEVRAQNSDASQVGTTQGKEAGYERSEVTGKKVGTAKGEAEAIKKNEDAPLNKVKIAGQFAAAFDKMIPSYPGPSNHSYSTFEANKFKRQVVRKAYIDGYDFRYRNASRRQFEDSIDDIYSDAYGDAHEKYYYEWYNQFYQESYADGKNDGESEGFNAMYPLVKQDYFNKFESQFSSQPNRQAAEYLSTYKKSEQDAYVRHYEEIRSNFFDKYEEQTFAANIEAQTEKYRVLRYAQVDEVYVQNAVLSFISSEMLDGGIKGIAKGDSIFQPQEATLHSITIRNYGQQEAKGVVAKLDSGEKIVLPSIPAKTTATISQAVLGNVGNLEEGSTLSRSLSLLYPLSGEERIQGRHYDSLKGGVLTANDMKKVAVRYPLSLTGLATSQQLIKGSEMPISLTVNNRSSRSYTGPLSVNLTSSRPDVIKTPFATIQSLNSSTTTKNGSLLVLRDSDIYTPIHFDATITQNGVLLGKLDQEFTTMAKSKFTDKVGTPLVVANSDSSYDLILDVIDQLGGIDHVSIIDTSLRSLNTAALSQSFKNRVAIVLPKNGVIADSKGLVKSGQNLIMLIVGDQSAQNELISQPYFADKFAVKFDIKDIGERQLAISNHHRIAEMNGSTISFVASERDYRDDLALANALALSADELISKINRQVSLSDFFSLRADDSVLVSALHLKSILELGTINIAYDLSKKPGLFGSMLFGKRDKKWIEMIEKDQNLVITKLQQYAERAIAKKEVSPALLAAFQNTYVTDNALKNFKPISKDILSDIESAAHKITEKTKDSITKSLKSINRELYNRIDDERHLYTPFEPGTDYGCMPGAPNFPSCQNGH